MVTAQCRDTLAWQLVMPLAGGTRKLQVQRAQPLVRPPPIAMHRKPQALRVQPLAQRPPTAMLRKLRVPRALPPVRRSQIVIRPNSLEPKAQPLVLLRPIVTRLSFRAPKVQPPGSVTCLHLTVMGLPMVSERVLEDTVCTHRLGMERTPGPGPQPG